MDRRNFLLTSVGAAAGAATKSLGQSSNPLAARAYDGTEPNETVQPAGAMAPPVKIQEAANSDFSPFAWRAAGLVFAFQFAGAKLRFASMLPEGYVSTLKPPVPADISGLETSIHTTGSDIPDHHGAKFTGGIPGITMEFAGKQEEMGQHGPVLVIAHRDAAVHLEVKSRYETFGDIPVVRRSASVTNTGGKAVGLEYVSSAMLNHFAPPETFQDDLKLHFAYNSWRSEGQWHSVRMADAGLVQNGDFSVSGVLFSTLGSWPCQSYLPMAMIENTRLGVTWFWQVEHCGSWHCEIAQTATRALYAYLGGPDAQHSQAWRRLRPAETYETVPVALGCVRGGFEEAVEALTRYRRAIQTHPRRDLIACPVVFNDVVALDGNQTTEKELPLIDAAARLGCEVYCMDVGWYTKPGENWWGPVGDWVPNPKRFPGGLRRVTDYIRLKGMTAGLWIEPEVAGLKAEVSKRPDEWFFMRHSRRVIDHSRYQLDYRNPAVRAYIDAVFDRLIDDYGVGYIKLDYNINALEGTETRADSFGQGLLGHNRAFLEWLNRLLDRYPRLTIETVASGSMRMEYSMLSRCQLQSISDQDNYRYYASLTTGSSAALLPEQMGVWSQPLKDDEPEAVSCNMVNAMLGRIHQSGPVTGLSPSAMAQISHGIDVYRSSIRRYVPQFIPFYPLGMPSAAAIHSPAALGMRAGEKRFLAAWRREGPPEVHVPGRFAAPRLLYPAGLGIRLARGQEGFTVYFPKPNMGCIVAA